MLTYIKDISLLFPQSTAYLDWDQKQNINFKNILETFGTVP